ncbi:MAG TPA: Holliday junction resolvase RuvX [Gemmataceae bacterium]|nr:Holliday junction resolvase RuvX [Gemmataceae bacterium]
MSEQGRLLGVDYGSVRVGLAVCDADRIIASPLEVRERKGDAADAAYFKQVVAREQIGGLVVGLPVHTDGREGVKAVEARAFGTWLAEVTGLPVVYADERFSTAFAESALWAAGLTHKKRKQRRDAVAAQVMLQGYIEGGQAGGALDG